MKIIATFEGKEAASKSNKVMIAHYDELSFSRFSCGPKVWDEESAPVLIELGIDTSDIYEVELETNDAYSFAQVCKRLGEAGGNKISVLS